MLDNRIGMDENGTQTWTLYDGSDPVMDFNSSGSLEMRYLNGPTGDLVDTIIARESAGGTVAWYLPDRLGTIRDLINNSGSIIDHVDYSAFGTVLDESSPSNGDRMMGFAGMERDTVTGLNLAVNRVQNPGTGRWTSPDPLGFAGGDAELYRYVGNSPVEQLDPIGTDPHYDGGNITSWDRTYLRLQYLYIRSALQGLQKRAMTDEQRSTVRFWQSLFENAKVCKVEYMDSDDLAGTNKYTNVIHFGRKHFQLSLEGQLVSWFHELYHTTGYGHPPGGPNLAEEQGQLMARALLLFADKERERLEKLRADYTWDELLFEFECGSAS